MCTFEDTTLLSSKVSDDAEGSACRLPLQDLDSSDQQLRLCDAGRLEKVADVFPPYSSAEPQQTGEAVTSPS